MVKQKFVATTDSKHTYPVSENLLNREFEVAQLGKVWGRISLTLNVDRVGFTSHL